MSNKPVMDLLLYYIYLLRPFSFAKLLCFCKWNLLVSISSEQIALHIALFIFHFSIWFGYNMVFFRAYHLVLCHIIVHSSLGDGTSAIFLIFHCSNGIFT